MRLISVGKNDVYRVKCPHCGSIIEAQRWEFGFFEGMDGEPLVELRKPCPNCERRFSMLRQDFDKCLVHKNDSPKKKG